MTEQTQVPATDTAPTPVTTDRTLGELHEAPSATSTASVEEAIGPMPSGEIGQDVAGFASDLHTYLQQNITWADTKAAFLFAAAGGLIAFLHNQGLTKRIVPKLLEIPNTLGNTVGMIALGALIVAGVAAFGTFWPRTKGDAEGIVFWKAIATKYKTGHSFAETVLDRSPRALAEAKLHHCWELAKVCQRKFKWVNVATFATAVGSVASLLYLAFWPAVSK